MIEEILIQYGVLGVWIAYFIFEKKKFQDKATQAIENNTIALNKISYIVENCKRNNNAGNSK